MLMVPLTNAEAMGSNPVEVRKIFCDYNCDDHVSILTIYCYFQI